MKIKKFAPILLFVFNRPDHTKKVLESLKNNLLNNKEYNSIINHIANSNLPSNLNKYFKITDLNKILSFMLKDKKNSSNKINLVLLKKIGYPIINKEYNKNTLNLFLKSELIN